MQNVEKDLRYAREILENMEDCYDFLDSDRLYQRTNEPLSFIFSNFDFKGKDVFSVLASGDQAFSFYFNDVRSLSTFDINPLTEYYYYLRKWSFEYGLGFYPFQYDTLQLQQLMNDVVPKFEEEEHAREFWGSLLYWYPNLMNSGLFFLSISSMETSFTGRENELIKKLPSNPLDFCVQDLFKPFFPDDTYDVAFISNILEYARGDVKKLDICCNNLASLLRDGGIVIGTNFMKESFDELARENEVFSSSFEFIPGEKRYSPILDELVDSYYVYQKK